MQDDIKRSPEIEAIVRRWLISYGRRDSDATTNLFSSSAALTYVGSAEGKFWTGDALRQSFAAYTEDVPDFVHSEDHVIGYERGQVGWAQWIGGTRRGDSGKSATYRTTFVLTLEQAVWRIVLIHNSNPVSNLESMGYEARGFDELMAAAAGTISGLGQTGVTSVMFTDIADSTILAETLGDARWQPKIEHHLGLVRQVIENANGTFVKSLGDGTMSSFSSARAAMRAAQTIQTRIAQGANEPRLRVRIGIHTGDVVESDGDFFGTVVNKAARVAALAAPDEIRVSDTTRIMVGGTGDFSFEDAAAVALKGLEGEHVIYRLAWTG